MPLFLIAGSAGVGKSTICKLLKDKEYEAYDIDDDGLARWRHNQTQYVYPKSSVKQADRTPEFLKDHSWVVPREIIEKLAGHAQKKPVFVCGALSNEDEVRDLFAATFALYVDDETLQYRLATRTSGDWGKQPHELAHTLASHHHIYDKYRSVQATIIDATQPLEDVLREILSDAKA